MMLAIVVIGVVLIVIAILFIASRMTPPEDEFRKRWGGNDARQTKERSYPCPSCGGHGYDDLGECVGCMGKGYVIGRDE